MRKHRFHLNITDRCNLRCVHCYWEEFGAFKDPSIQAIDDILLRFKSLGRAYRERGPHLLTIGGGEPTLRADLEQIIRLAVRRRFKLRLVTNATLIDPERAFSLSDAGLKIAQVSLDGATEATHDQVRGRGSWAKTMRGIEALKQARIFTVLSYVLLPGINMEEAPQLLDLVRKLNVAGAKFARPVRLGQAVLNEVRTEGNYWSIFKNILDHAQEIRYKRLLLFFDPLAHLLPMEEYQRTKGLWGLATDLCQCDNTELIEVDASSGDIYYCRIRKVLGNIRKDDLTKLWQSHPLLVSLRRKAPEGACDGCGAWKACRGGCPAVTYGDTGIVMIQDKDCHKVQEQGNPVAEFSSNGFYSHPVSDLQSSVRSLGKKAKDLINWLVLR